MNIGGWQVDVDKNQLIKDQTVIPLRHKVMHVLLYLAKHANRLVSRDELIAEIWNGNELVGKKGLTNAVWQLRSELGKTDLDTGVILTVPKKGYQLLLPVYPEHDPVGVESTQAGKKATLESEVTDKSPKRIPLVSVSASTIVLIIIVYFWRGGNFNSVAQIDWQHQVAVKQLHGKGRRLESVLSPDGDSFLYRKQASGQDDIYLRSLTHQAPQNGPRESRLTNHEDTETSFAFSPDATQIAFIRGDGENRCGIYLMDLLNRQSRLLRPCYNSLISKVTWATNKTLSIFDKREEQNIGVMYLYDIESRLSTLLPIPFSTKLYLEGVAKWSQDGRYLAFIRSLAVNSQDIFVYDFMNERTSRLTYDNAYISGLAWRPDNKTLVFSSNRDGSRKLWYQRVNEKLPTSLGVQGAWPSLAKKNQALLYESVNFRQKLMKLNTSVQKGLSVPLIDVPLDHSEPSLSSGSKRLTYALYQQNKAQIWQWDISSNTRRHIEFPSHLEDISQVSSSPDGKNIAFVARSPTDQFNQVYSMALEGGEVKQVSRDSGDHFAPSWAEDNATIFAATAITGRWEIWRYPVNLTPPSQLTFNGGGLVQQQGTKAYISKADGSGIWSLDGQGRESLLIGELRQSDWGNWYLTEKGIYFVARDSLQDRIVFYSFEDKTQRTIAQFSAGTIAQGKNLVFNQQSNELYFTINEINETHILARFSS